MGTPGLNRPLVEAMSVRYMALSETNSWADRAWNAAGWNLTGGQAVVSTNVIYSLSVTNTHASQTLYALLRANASEATSAAIPILAGATWTADLYGAQVQALSFQGSAAATTGVVHAIWGAP